MRRRAVIRAALVVLMAGAACAPEPPVPTDPVWVTSRAARTVIDGTITNYVGAWTDLDWAATLRVESAPGGSGSASLLVFPRSGPGNSTLGAPVTLALDPTLAPSLAGPLGEHLIAVPGALANQVPAVELFGRSGTTWMSAGIVTLPAGQQVVAMTDSWMVTRSTPTNPGSDAHVYLYPVVGSVPAMGIGAPVTLDPDPSWPLALREGFGAPGVSIDGGLIAVGAQGQFTPTPGGVRVFRSSGAGWSPTLSLGAATGSPTGYGRAVAVDDGSAVDRLAIAPQGEGAPAVQIYADSGSGFVLEQTITRDVAEPDPYNGAFFASAIALDGDLLAVTGRGADVPSAEAGHADVRVGYVHLFRKGATWSREAEVPAFLNPAPVDTISNLPFRMQVAGNHVGVVMFITPDPPPGCVFPCFNIGFESWSIDRTG